NNMSNATQKKFFEEYHCTGNHPHRLNEKSQCDSKVIPLQRGASNVYFSVLRSAISIPENVDKFTEFFRRNINKIEQFVNILNGLEVLFQVHYSQEDIFVDFDEFNEKFNKYMRSKEEDKHEVNKYE